MGRPTPVTRNVPQPTYSNESLGKSTAHSNTASLTEEDAEWIVKRTSLRVKQVVSKSNFMQQNCHLDDVPRFSHEDFNIGSHIASGGFSDVCAIDSFNVESDLEQDRHYVIKHLNPKLVAEPKKLAVGAKDLVMEAYFLSAIQHENIIGLRGMCCDGVAGYATKASADGFFLILDRLTATLSNKLSKWRRIEAQQNVKSPIFNFRGKSARNMITFKDRIQAAHDIANAVSYLHDQRILYRDIKPANIGFDEAGTLKLFDFGLAVELPPSDDPNQLYNLAGNTGTARYMAVEVIRNQPYNFSADVFSFAVLLWEIVALKKPFAELAGPEVKEWVSVYDNRLVVNRSWPSQIRRIMKNGWSENIEDRPTMKCVRDTLAEFL